MLFFILVHFCIVKARSILDELQLIRALHLVQPDDHYPHRFSAAPFTRHIQMHTATDSHTPFFNGVAFDYKYVHPYGHIGVVTALGFETDTYSVKSEYDGFKRFKRSRFGLDDIGISLNFSIIDHGKNYLNVSGLIGIATAAPNPLGTLVGAGHHQFGANMKFGFDVLEAHELSFAGEVQILQSLKSTVLLDKNMDVIHSKDCQKPFFRERFDLGTVFSNLLTLRKGSHDEGFETGYHGVIVFNVHDHIKPLSYEGFTRASMKSCIDRHKGIEKLTLHKDGHKPTYVHHIYAQYNTLYETRSYPVGFLLGGAYAFGTHFWKAFLAWAAISIHF